MDTPIEIVRKVRESLIFFGKLSTKSDAEIADMLIREVWPDIPTFSRKSDIVEEVCNRLRREQK